MTDSDISQPLNELPAYAMQQLARFPNIFMLASCLIPDLHYCNTLEQQTETSS